MVRMAKEEFEELVRDALTGIPDAFAVHLENVAVVVEDEPNPDDLERLGVDAEDDLLGLYIGVSLLDRGPEYSGLPDRIVIYRGPILRISDTYDDVVREVTETVVHELGHHMGMDDDEMVF